MTEALIGWIQWNTERRKERGKHAGEKAMKSAESFNSYIASVIRATKERGEEWEPTAILDRVMMRVNKQYQKGRRRKLPLFLTMVDEMERQTVLDWESEDDLQVITIMMISIFGLLRISEILHLEWRDVKKELLDGRDENGRRVRAEMITLTLRNTKSKFYNGGLPENAVICERRRYKARKKGNWDPIRLMDRWWGARVKRNAHRLTEKVFDMGRDVYTSQLRKALESIGISGVKYSTHSGRIGGATMLWEGGASDSEIKEIGRWRSDTWKVYCRQVKSKCLLMSAMLGRSELEAGSLVAPGTDLTIEVGEER